MDATCEAVMNQSRRDWLCDYAANMGPPLCGDAFAHVELGPVYVTLADDTMQGAARVGVRRREESVSFQDKHGAEKLTDDEQLKNDILAAQAEAAAAVALGVDWPGSVNAPKGDPDIPPDWQVRWTRSHNNRLIVRDSDRDDQRFVLVTGEGPLFEVHGWIFGHDAKRDEFRRAVAGRVASYFVDKKLLIPMERLPWPTR